MSPEHVPSEGEETPERSAEVPGVVAPLTQKQLGAIRRMIGDPVAEAMRRLARGEGNEQTSTD